MTKVNFSNKPTRADEVYSNFDELYDDISSDWQAKADRLRARRWRKLKHQSI